MTSREFLDMIEGLDRAEELDAPRRVEDEPERSAYVIGYGWSQVDISGWEDFE